MATRFSGDARKAVGSPRPKGRENSKDTLCRNVLIYGHCRYEDQGCAFNHDPNKMNSNHAELSKKSLNVDSPSFTPAALPNTAPTTISSRAASAAPFTPRAAASGTTTPSLQEEPPAFNPANIREFTPSAFDVSSASSLNGNAVEQQNFDPFTMSAVGHALPSGQFNPYLEDTTGLANSTAAYFAGQAGYAAVAQPLQYHLYAPLGPHREDLLPYQRQAHNFFLPEKMREDLQRKLEASLQVMPNSQLPTLDNYHSLVPLDTSHHKSTASFGYNSWVYKATSSKNGNLYCLRRLEGYRLTNEKAIRAVKDWKRVDAGGIVTVHDAFTTRAFGDSSLIVVTDYHPLSKTLVEHHFSTPHRYGMRPPTAISEQALWSYIVQIASALKAVHGAGLAVRNMDPSKVILTDKNRIRLSGCAVLDVVNFDTQRSILELQQEDFLQFGKLVLSIATNNLASFTVAQNAVEQLSRSYSADLRDTVLWLLTAGQSGTPKMIDDFLRGIAPHMAASFDSSLHLADNLNSHLAREVENGRLFRLVAKLGAINERPEYDNDKNWSETGDRYLLKLFRDYVFHQVDAEGKPVVDLGHMISCLNKLDAGIDEKIVLTSRDEQTCMLVSYRELRNQVSAAFGELTKPGKAGNRAY